MNKIIILSAIIIALFTNAWGQRTANADPDAAKFVTTDIELFWNAYDLATPENNLNVFRNEYLKKGSDGLKDFVKLRPGDTCNLVGTIEAVPKYYEALREPSLKVASYENQMRTSFRKMKNSAKSANIGH